MEYIIFSRLNHLWKWHIGRVQKITLTYFPVTTAVVTLTTGISQSKGTHLKKGSGSSTRKLLFRGWKAALVAPAGGLNYIFLWRPLKKALAVRILYEATGQIKVLPSKIYFLFVLLVMYCEYIRMYSAFFHFSKLNEGRPN